MTSTELHKRLIHNQKESKVGKNNQCLPRALTKGKETALLATSCTWSRILERRGRGTTQWQIKIYLISPGCRAADRAGGRSVRWWWGGYTCSRKHELGPNMEFGINLKEHVTLIVECQVLRQRHSANLCSALSTATSEAGFHLIPTKAEWGSRSSWQSTGRSGVNSVTCIWPDWKYQDGNPSGFIQPRSWSSLLWGCTNAPQPFRNAWAVRDWMASYRKLRNTGQRATGDHFTPRLGSCSSEDGGTGYWKMKFADTHHSLHGYSGDAEMPWQAQPIYYNFDGTVFSESTSM